MNPQRHHLIYLAPDVDFSIASFHEDKNAIEEGVRSWLAKGLPCIYAKQLPNEETMSLGFPLVSGNKNHRVGLRIAPSAVQKLQPLPQLMAMQDFLALSHLRGQL
ncbi:MAG: hypothetical protein ACRCXC_01955 [Legionella sp.]